MAQRFKQHLSDVIDGRNMLILEMSRDLNLQEHFQTMIKDLDLTEQTFKSRLRYIIISILGDNSTNNGRFISLLLFSKELDSYLMMHSKWYRRDVLIEQLHTTLLEINYKLITKEEYSFWGYTMIIFLCSIVLILF